MEITCIPSFTAYYERIRYRTDRVVECIPDDAMEWRLADGRFSFGDLLRHLAGLERYMFAENVAGRPSSYPGHERRLADGADVVRAYFATLHVESMAIFTALAESDLHRPCVIPAGAQMPVWKWLRAMIEHEVHHRGQLYQMLGVLGVATPPVFGQTSEQLRALSTS